ncbi:hypothetical protein K1X84_10500 [bacterium]|nr:hypothetical protein [bacterium]
MRDIPDWIVNVVIPAAVDILNFIRIRVIRVRLRRRIDLHFSNIAIHVVAHFFTDADVAIRITRVIGNLQMIQVAFDIFPLKYPATQMNCS